MFIFGIVIKLVMLMLLRVLTTIILVLMINGQVSPSTRADISEIFECFDKGRCGVASLGAFKLSNITNRAPNAFYSKSTSEPRPGNVIEGHIYEFYNGLDVAVTYYWEVLPSPGVPHHAELRPVIIEAGETKYVDSQTYPTHTVRVYLARNTTETSFELMDTIVGLEGRKCAGGKKALVCDYLFSVCYKTQQNAYYVEGTTNATRCQLYEDACADITSKNTGGATCVGTCMEKYYSHLLSFQQRRLGVKLNVHPEAVLKCVVEYEHKATSMQPQSKVSPTSLSSQSSWNSMIVEESYDLPTYEELSALHDTDAHTIYSLNTAVTTITILLIIAALAFVFSCFTYCRSTDFKSPYRLVKNDETSTSSGPKEVAGRIII